MSLALSKDVKEITPVPVGRRGCRTSLLSESMSNGRRVEKIVEVDQHYGSSGNLSGDGRGKSALSAAPEPDLLGDEVGSATLDLSINGRRH